ncbi:tRNA pseudouridine(55) synthase TruB [Virgibacillus dakarensis]|uniref:tRNA pseudouridine synthase B n=1 Tax=Lentibacillus populi TaxID=1827502 RepID=A0A9W5TUB6_9BACI|nr:MULTISPECIES: tRNA pseudouridine(55) synthase TruB [Bacillaceae]MTW84938.1 tRNA pseudouridine(55) synthase TruB [Virgibacillus dakarensis]GGB30663.1 tRNA pseudouridine synthase B [Lentibacillus populi]
MDGIIPLWKPKGLTSHDCVMKIRKLLHMKKVGHTGTLDPEAEGVLPICVGQATKIVPFLTDTNKTYLAEITLGTATETEDGTGQVIDRKMVEKQPALQAIETVLQSFTGEITQIPPMYSAVKVNGKKLYEYARANQPVDRPERTVTIFELAFIEFINDASFKINVVCSKGTYIRTLCVDIGQRLGYPAHMSALTRTRTGSIAQSDTVTFTAIEKAVKMDQTKKLLLPITRGLTHLDCIMVDDDTKQKVLCGQKLAKRDLRFKTDPFLMMHQDKVLAIYQTHPENDKQIKPVRVFS